MLGHSSLYLFSGPRKQGGSVSGPQRAKYTWPLYGHLAGEMDDEGGVERQNRPLYSTRF